MAAAGLLLLSVSGCTLVGYPSGHGDTAPSPAGIPAAPVGGPSDAGRTYEVFGVRYQVMDQADGYRERGIASWYGEEFAGRPTSSGEIFDPDRPSAAHRTLPLNTWVEVTNLDNGRQLTVRINDRGPFARTDERIIDLSYAAARQLGVVGPGTARVEVRALSDREVAQAARR